MYIVLLHAAHWHTLRLQCVPFGVAPRRIVVGRFGMIAIENGQI
ncbi:MAG: hypothetical protein WA191_09210 [Telluria sp.]|nr:hypothetical protein [Telluria sp.]